MKITASMVKELRSATAAGVLDCRNALIEAEGDFDKATEYLRKQGMAEAEKRMKEAQRKALLN